MNLIAVLRVLQGFQMSRNREKSMYIVREKQVSVKTLFFQFLHFLHENSKLFWLDIAKAFFARKLK